MTIGSQIIKYGVGIIGPAILAAAYTAYFTRRIEADIYGQFGALVAFSSIVVPLFSQWIQQPVGRRLSEGEAAQREGFVKAISLGLASTTFLLVIVCCVCWFADLQPHVAVGAGVSLVIYMAVQMHLNIGLVMFQARAQAGWYALAQLIVAIARFAFTYLVVSDFTSVTANHMMWAYTASAAFALIFIFSKTSLYKGVVGSNILDLIRDVKSILQYGAPMTIWFALTTLISMGDRLLISKYDSLASVGIYSANFNLMNGTIGLISAPILAVAWPRLMRSWNDGNKALTARWLGIVVSLLISASIFLIGLVFAVSSEISHFLLGEKFRGGYSLMPSIVTSMMLLAVANYAHKPFEFFNKTKQMVFFAAIAATLWFFLNMALIPVYGYVVAPLAAAMSYLLYVILCCYFGRRLLPWAMNGNILSFGTALAFIGFGATKISDYLIGGEPLLFVLACKCFLYILPMAAALSLKIGSIKMWVKEVGHG